MSTRNNSARRRLGRRIRGGALLNLALWAVAGCAGANAASSVPGVARSDDPFAGRHLYVATRTKAHRQANMWKPHRPDDARLMVQLAKQPVALWLRGSASGTELAARTQVRKAERQGTTALLAISGIPGGDCQGGTADAVEDASAYRTWLQRLRRAIGRADTVVILEPGALATASFCDGAAQARRYELLSDAVEILSRDNVAVYVDAGIAVRNPSRDIVDRLRRAGIARARGFALNVGDYVDTKLTITYGVWLAEELGTQFVVDTSRNGRGVPEDGERCNARGRGLGLPPNITDTREPRIDAYLWVKVPGESDGECNGGPPQDEWWPKLALELVKNTFWIRAAALLPSPPTPPLPPEPGPRDDLVFDVETTGSFASGGGTSP